MAGITLAAFCNQRHSYSFGAERAVALVGQSKNITEGLVDSGVVRRKPAAVDMQNVAFVEDCLAGNVGMNDTAGAIDQKDAVTESIDRFGDIGAFGLAELDRSCNQHGAAHVGRDKAHPPASVLVSATVVLVPGHPQQRDTRTRFLKRDVDAVDQALGLRPFPEESRLVIVAVIQQAGVCYRLPDAGEEKTVRSGIDLA